MAALGSDAWQGADDYEEGSQLHTRAVNFVEEINWNALLLAASNLRGGVSCELSEKFSRGHFNLVRKVEFADGVNWLARLRLPEIGDGAGEALDAGECMKIEIAAMRLLKDTSIPVPEVFGFDLSLDNAVGARFMFMTYLHGTTASDLRMARDCDFGVFGTPEQDERFWRQMAEIHVRLASIQFDSIGSVYFDGSERIVGPEIQIGTGTWQSSQQYWEDLAAHQMTVAEKTAPSDVKESPSFHLPERFVPLISSHGKPDQNRFSLANRDFGAHNVLVDDDFNIIALIDLDGVMSAPIELVAQFPTRMGVDRPVPGHLETRPMVVEFNKKRVVLIQKYIELVRQAGGHDLAEALESEASKIVQGLVAYGMHQIFVNEPWIEYYERLSQSS